MYIARLMRRRPPVAALGGDLPCELWALLWYVYRTTDSARCRFGAFLRLLRKKATVERYRRWSGGLVMDTYVVGSSQKPPNKGPASFRSPGCVLAPKEPADSATEVTLLADRTGAT
jgi:hypothetical protein